MRPDHYDTGEHRYRERSFAKYEHKCAVCGWDEDEDVLEVHHIDENRSNNSIDNLIILCPTCHRKLTTGKYYLQDRIKINKY
jgi:5-methylcytosine-specific restriction endonuclease McrA